jgi:hypothetical protein
MTRGKAVFFWTILYGLTIVAVVGVQELASSFVVPSWPARELRPFLAASAEMRQLKTLAETPQLVPTYNSWNMRDRERTLERPPGVSFRSVFVGDSFLEGVVNNTPPSEMVEGIWAKGGHGDMEAINLGVSATGPKHYYYRIKNVALSLKPDLLLLMFCSSNDFDLEPLSEWSVPPMIAERPKPSLLGTAAPRLTWLAVNRFGLSEFHNSNKPIPNEWDILNDLLKRPRDERIELYVQHLKKYYFPETDPGLLREILRRGGSGFWEAFERKDGEREYLDGWILANMVGSESEQLQPVPKDVEEAEASVNQKEIDATMTWLMGAEALARQHNVKFVVALAPPSTVDPRYEAFWRPWPKFSSWNISRTASHRRLAAALRAKGVSVIDLEPDLRMVSGSYRLSDGHWTELGTEIVAQRLSRELLALQQ